MPNPQEKYPVSNFLQHFRTMVRVIRLPGEETGPDSHVVAPGCDVAWEIVLAGLTARVRIVFYVKDDLSGRYAVFFWHGPGKGPVDGSQAPVFEAGFRNLREIDPYDGIILGIHELFGVEDVMSS